MDIDLVICFVGLVLAVIALGCGLWKICKTRMDEVEENRIDLTRYHAKHGDEI